MYISEQAIKAFLYYFRVCFLSAQSKCFLQIRPDLRVKWLNGLIEQYKHTILTHISKWTAEYLQSNVVFVVFAGLFTVLENPPGHHKAPQQSTHCLTHLTTAYKLTSSENHHRTRNIAHLFAHRYTHKKHTNRSRHRKEGIWNTSHYRVACSQLLQ